MVSYHLCAPNAGEITQGVAMAIKSGMTKAIMDSTLGIHPTVAEESLGLKWTKADKVDVNKKGC